ncbi:MAG: hypothetical protein AB7G88_13685, partial [Thermomicrobiales bacterium]
MRWGSDDIGVVLTRNEIWLVLHALAEAAPPAVDWEGNRVEPWVIGELRARLQAALQPDALGDVEERPIVRLDSEMGQSLAQAGVRPLVLSDGYDLGSLMAGCAERGWGAEVRLPVGAGPKTPAEAVVSRGTGQRAGGTGEDGSDLDVPRSFVGLERPVVALARAMIGAAEGTGHWAPGNREEGKGQRAKGDGDDVSRTTDMGPRGYEEYVAPVEGMNPGERGALVERMAKRGWE